MSQRGFFYYSLLLFFISVVPPFYINGSPSESGSKCCENQVISLFELILKIPKAERKCTGTCVAIPFDVHHDFLRWYSQPLCDCRDNALIGLMGNHPIDLLLTKMIPFDQSLASIGHIGYCIFEHGASFLINIMHLVIQRIVGGRTYRTACFYM